jgi:hypothetical protein
MDIESLIKIFYFEFLQFGGEICNSCRELVLVLTTSNFVPIFDNHKVIKCVQTFLQLKGMADQIIE